MKIYRAFGFSYSAYVEVKVPESSPFPVSEKEIQTAKDILDSTLSLSTVAPINIIASENRNVTYAAETLTASSTSSEGGVGG